MAVREIDGVWVIASRQMWLPGNYDSARTARWAFRFTYAILSRLEAEVNQQQQRPITAADIRSVRDKEKVTG